MYYNSNNDGRERFIKIELSRPIDIYDVRNYLQGTSDAHRCIKMPHGAVLYKLELFEEQGLAYADQFMRDTGLTGFGWVSVAKMSFDLSSPSTATWDIICTSSEFIAHTSGNSDEYGNIAPLRVMTFDIECLATTREFPTPQRDPVIQIGVHVKEFGSSGERRILDTVLLTGSTDEIGDGCIVAEYKNERDLLLGFRDLCVNVDYDISRAFNQRTFDWPYLFDRAEALGIDDEFTRLGRLKNVLATIKRNDFSSKQAGQRAYRDPNISGRCDFDILDVIRDDVKLRSYKLNNVSWKVLKQTKEDVHHSMISILYRGSSADRCRLARYCRKDALLPVLIDEKRLLLIRYIELARVCGVTLEQLIRRGQQIKVLTQIARIALELDIVLPIGQQLTPYTPTEFEGGLVLEPITGMHEDPIACLDFSSLYPSEGCANNIDYHTLVRPEDVDKLSPDDYFRSEQGHCFVKKHIRKGVLVILWERWLAARKVAKTDMKACERRAEECQAAGDDIGAAKWKFDASVQDARQLALKLCSNAAYGFTAVPLEMGGKLTCFEVSESITGCGRRDLRRVVNCIQRWYPDAIIVYGDTDSVMVKPGVKTVREAFEWMECAAERINKEEFGNEAPMRLAPEKIMCPMLLLAKKRYIDGYHESNPDKPDKVHYRGVEVVRRDACELMSKCLESCCEEIFINRNVEAAVQCAKDVVQQLYLNKVNMSELVMSKSLSRPLSEYTTPQAHTILAAKMTKRDSSTAPIVGDRVQFVMVGEGTDGVRDLAEDPLYVLEHEIPINVSYYINNQLKKPLERLFIPIIGTKRTSEIFRGDHTRKRIKPRSTKPPATNSIMMFATLDRTCAQCREAYQSDHPSLCSTCVVEHGESAVVEKVGLYKIVKQRFDAQMAICQACQGSDRDPVLCMARDCRELYARKDLEMQCSRLETDMEDMTPSKRSRGI